MRERPSDIARELAGMARYHGSMPADPYEAYVQACMEVAASIEEAERRAVEATRNIERHPLWRPPYPEAPGRAVSSQG